MKIVLFAYRNCGYECLKYLIKINKKPVLVVFPKEEDQSEKVFKSVKKLAISSNTRFFEFEKNNDNLEKEISSLAPDYGFSCYFPYIIDGKILSVFKKHSFNIHGGILPDYKGTFSSVWSIINNEKESGATIHLMTEKVDSGNIIEIHKCKIETEDTGFSLYNKVVLISLNLFQKYIGMLYAGVTIKSIQQLPESGNYYSREIPFNGKIDWNWTSHKISNFCRAMFFPPFKSAITSFNGNEIEIDSVKVTAKKSSKLPGEIVSIEDNNLRVATYDFDIIVDSEGINIKQFNLKRAGKETNLFFK